MRDKRKTIKEEEEEEAFIFPQMESMRALKNTRSKVDNHKSTDSERKMIGMKESTSKLSQ